MAAPLRDNPAFRRYWCARLASYAGDQIAHTALLIAVFDHRGGRAMGLLLLAGTAPRLLGPLLGALADRANQRRLMVACDAGQAALYLVIALTRPSLPVLLTLIALATGCATLFTPSGRSLLPRMVGIEHIGAANAQLAVAVNIGLAAGPALGGLLLAGLGLTGTLLVNVATFVLSATLIATMRARSVAHPAAGTPAQPGRVSAVIDPPTPNPAVPAEPFGEVLRGGLAVVRSHPVVRTVCVGFFLSVAFAALDNVAVIPLARSVLHTAPGLVGLLGTGYGLGMVAAPLLLTRGGRGFRADRVLYAALATFGAGTLLTGVSPVLGLAIAGQVLAGAGEGWQNVANDTLIQQHVPQERLGTVFGTVYTFPYAAAALAYLAGGQLLAHTGPRPVLVLAGAGVAVTLAVTYPMLVKALRAADRAGVAPGPPH